MQTLTIEQALALAAILNNTPGQTPSNSGNGRPVIVRCRDAGVHYGHLVSYQGREVKLTDARRMWSWTANKGVALSGCAAHGINSAKSKIDSKVSAIILTEACEIIDCTAEAAATIEAA